jgi:hypothetical protein
LLGVAAGGEFAPLPRGQLILIAAHGQRIGGVRHFQQREIRNGVREKKSAITQAIHAHRDKRLKSFAIAVLGGAFLLSSAGHAAAPGISAQFRGCESTGWCKFWLDPRDTREEPLHRVRPLGIPEMRGNDDVSIAVRDRLNALMSSFVHQHKRILLYDLRPAGDGTYEASITVNEAPLTEDPPLQELAAQRNATR